MVTYDKQTAIRFTQRQFEEIDAHATSLGLSFATFVRQAALKAYKEDVSVGLDINSKRSAIVGTSTYSNHHEP